MDQKTWIRNKLFHVFYFTLLIFLDQITKYSIPRDFLVKNHALPFGFDFGNWNIVFLILAAILLIGYLLQIRKNLNQSDRLSLVLIFAGAIANLIDRLSLGYVRDFVNLGIITVNFADLFIIGGLFMLLFKHEKSFRH